MCAAVVLPSPHDRNVDGPGAGGRSTIWPRWTLADLTAAAAEAGWSRGAIESLLGAMGSVLGADRGAVWIPGREVHWSSRRSNDVDAAASADHGEGERLIEFCGTTRSGASVMMLWECSVPPPDAEDIVDDAGRLLVEAWELTEECTTHGVPGEHCDLHLVLRAATLQMRVGDVLLRHQAAGTLAQRFDLSIADADQRVCATAERFQLSVSGFAEHLLGHAHVGS